VSRRVDEYIEIELIRGSGRYVRVQRGRGPLRRLADQVRRIAHAR
jgi:hypothetical protein